MRRLLGRTDKKSDKKADEKSEGAVERMFREFGYGTAYKESIGLYRTVKQNEMFFVGRQWEGLNAPDLDKPVMNFLKRVVNYIVAMVVSDSIAASVLPMYESPDNDIIAEILSKEVDRIFERNHMNIKNRDAVRDAAVDGDCFFHCYFDRESREIVIEPVANTNVHFGNPYVSDLQKQPYILIEKPMLLDAVRREAKAAGADPENIRPDGEEREPSGEGYGAARTTVLLRFWKDERTKTVHFSRAARGALLQGPADTGYRGYPLCYMSWDKVKDSYHGQAALTGLIANQIAVNKLWAMALRHQQMMAFPKVFYDRMKIREWNNRVGEAIGVTGNPNDAVAGGFRAPDMSGQLIELVDRTIQYSRDFLGASDTALGNVKPENTSAILAVQKASAAPLELQRLAFYQLTEDCLRILVDIMRADYGTRRVRHPGGGAREIDFSKLDGAELDLKVDIGAASYWSEIGQMETMDNLFSKGIITDAVTYLEGIPAQYLKNKNKLIGKLREHAKRCGSDAEGAGRERGRGNEMSGV